MDLTLWNGTSKICGKGKRGSWVGSKSEVVYSDRKMRRSVKEIGDNGNFGRGGGGGGVEMGINRCCCRDLTSLSHPCVTAAACRTTVLLSRNNGPTEMPTVGSFCSTLLSPSLLLCFFR